MNAKIPKTDSISELAQFWDTCDITDFEDDMEEVSESVFEQDPDTEIAFHLQSREIEALKHIAKSRGLTHDALLREWVREKLQSV